MKVIVKNIIRVFDEFFKIDRAVIQHEKFDGTMTNDIIRLNFNRGQSVCVLLYNPHKDTILLTNQFRFPAYSADKAQGWILELPAGMVDGNTKPVDAAKKEVLEEMGYKINNLKLIYDFFPSPGGSSERLFMYYAEVSDEDKITSGGGLDSEHEDIETVELNTAEAFQLLDNRKIYDAKTIIALQWLMREIAY